MDRFPRRFGPYVLVEMLGVGGMGEVVLALSGQPGKEKLCVVKRLYPECRGQPEAEERFRREGQLVLRLSHGAIAQTLAVGEQDGETYIVQEFIEGRDLKQVITLCASLGERLSIEMSIHIVCEVARALGYVHDHEERGLVHRDVSPANIRLAYSGEVKLLDFGVARAAAQTVLTQVGHVLGRPTYTAPELNAGQRADRRADVYSLGVVLWELLCGRPYTGEREDVMRDNPAVAPALNEVVARAIHPDRAQRYESASALRQALGSLIPSGYDGERAIREFLAAKHDIARERKLRSLAARRLKYGLSSTLPWPLAQVTFA